MKHSAFTQHRQNVGKGEFHEERQSFESMTDLPVRLIAYYLPQFHRIDENDRWWGKGFTEWTNVTRVMPFFRGHYQPHLPDALGFYNLADPDVLRQQVELAKAHGIGGFCFHHYWFSGRRLLEKPLQNLLDNDDIDMPFCINWANESWSRRWDGSETDVLMKQEYRDEDDLLFARSILPILRDRRYIRIDGRPLLMVYRPGEFPDIRRTVARWRAFFVAEGVGDPFIIMPQAFGVDDPRTFAMDGAAGFPPHKTGFDLPDRRHDHRAFDPDHAARIMRYVDLVDNSLANRPTDYAYFPGVCPGWDNTPRRGSKALVFQGATPALYGEWLASVCRWIMREQPDPERRIVFVNAWNEWAEGAHLEPDRAHGHAFLAETRRRLEAVRDGPDDPIRLGRRVERPPLATRVAHRLLRGLAQAMPSR